jgi:hypothetical protein
MAKKETTTEALTRMLTEQEKKKIRTVTKDGGVVINHPGNKGMVAGRVKGDFTW